MDALPAERTRAGVVVEAGQVTRGPVTAGAVVAHVRHRHLAQAGSEADGAGAGESWR